MIIATAVREKTKETHRATLNGLEKELLELEEIHEEQQKETHEKVTCYTAEIKEKEKEIERLDVLYIMCEKVPNRWHNGMKEAFKKINGGLYYQGGMENSA